MRREGRTVPVSEESTTSKGGSGWRALFGLLVGAFPGLRARMVVITGLAVVGAVIEAVIVLLIAGIGSTLADGGSEMRTTLLGMDLQLGNVAMAAVVLGLAGARAVLDLVLIEIKARTEARYESTARRRVARLYLDADWELQSSERSGGLQALLVAFISHGRGLLQQVTATIVSTCSLLIMLLASLAVGRVATLGAVVFLGLVALMLRSFVGRSRLASVANREATVRFSDRINETVAMALEVRTLGVSDEIAARLGEDIDDLASAQYRSSTSSYRLTSVHTTLTYVAVGFGLLALVLLDVADPQPYAAMVLLLYRAMVYGRAVQSGYQNIAGAQPYLEELQDKLSTYRASRQEHGSALPEHVDDLRVERVSFSYREGSTALDGVSFEVEAREALGIVGPSGAGKSTIVQMLLGLRHPQSGRVSLGGVDLQQVAPSRLTRLVGYVPQDSHLFDASVLDNVICFRPWISEEDAAEALRRAHVLDEVLAMADGLQSAVGVGGRMLSGGQRQRVCIARALAGSPELLILDEPTSALDLASEESIRRTLEELRGRMSLVIIAHRMSTLRVCDRILVLKDGKVEMVGRRDELEAESEYYAEAVRLAKLV